MSRRVALAGRPRTPALVAVGVAVPIIAWAVAILTVRVVPSTARGSQPAPACDILVIEDDPGVADVLRLALQGEGHTVDVAADGDEGLTYLQQRHYRLLLLDLLLPRLDGMGVLRALREQPAQRPPVVMILSALQGRTDVVRALEAGADDYLTKPFAVDDLVLRVNLWLRRADPVTAGGILELRRIAAERARLLVTEQERSRRLAELAVLKADFTAMVTHELGSPLAAIRGFLDMLTTGELSPSEEAQALATMRTETAMLTALVADAQAAATMERDDFAIHPRAVSVGVLLADAIAFAHALPGAHPLSTTIATHEWVHADPERIGQVLRNLLGNAAKYSPAGTPIEVRAARHGERVHIAVADHGFGIHPDDVACIFEKFGRGRDPSGRQVAGVGLGLYLSRRIVQAHGAELYVDSTPGVGSVFAFDLEVAR